MAGEEKQDKAKEAAPAASAPAASGGGGGKLLVLLTGVNLLVTVGVMAVLAYSFKAQKHPSVSDIQVSEGGHEGGEGGEKAEGGEKGKGKGGEEAEAAAAKRFGKMVALDQFTINLTTTGSVAPKFARVNISLHVPTEDADAELAQKMARVRNTIIDLFNSKRPSDLATTEGRNFLKDEIKKSLNAFLVTGKVDGVFFTNFALSG